MTMSIDALFYVKKCLLYSISVYFSPLLPRLRTLYLSLDIILASTSHPSPDNPSLNPPQVPVRIGREFDVKIRNRGPAYRARTEGFLDLDLVCKLCRRSVLLAGLPLRAWYFSDARKGVE
jgi:hypothetical protein